MKEKAIQLYMKDHPEEDIKPTLKNSTRQNTSKQLRRWH